MSQTRALYRLQKLDLDIDSRRSRAHEIAAALEQDQTLREVQAQVADLENTLRPQETRAADLNLEIQSVTEQAAQLSDRLYSGTVGNPKELEDIEHKLAERKRRRATLEDDLLETMIRVEELQATLTAAQEHRRDVEATWSEKNQALSSELQRVKHELKKLKIDRQAAAESVNAENLEFYENLRARKKGHAVAVLEDDSCSICRVEQTANIVQQVRQGQQLILCTSCGRILVVI